MAPPPGAHPAATPQAPPPGALLAATSPNRPGATPGRLAAAPLPGRPGAAAGSGRLAAAEAGGLAAGAGGPGAGAGGPGAAAGTGGRAAPAGPGLPLTASTLAASRAGAAPPPGTLAAATGLGRPLAAPPLGGPVTAAALDLPMAPPPGSPAATPTSTAHPALIAGPLSGHGTSAGPGAAAQPGSITRQAPAPGTLLATTGLARPSALATGPALPVTGPDRPAAPTTGGITHPGPLDAEAQRTPLAARPPAGPSVLPPRSAGDLPVIGGAPVPPGGGPDPTGAVQLTARPGPAFGHGHAHGAPRPAAPLLARSPRERWEAAVAARPLEAPRPLPTSLHTLARSITGRAHPPRYTAGPATSHALAAAGALGATTGSVVHLPVAPVGGAAATAVLAHELAHTRNPVRRPRFLLSGASGLLDDDERQAVAAGRGLLSGAASSASSLASEAAGMASDAASGISAGIVDRLPVGGGLGGVRELVTRTTQEVLESLPQPPAPALPAALPSLGGMTAPAVPAADGAWTPPGLPAPAAVTAPGAAAAGSTLAAGGQPAQALDPDKIVAAVEERLLREIERRGGRWAGVF